MTRGEIAALGYVGLEVSDLEAWRGFAVDILGLGDASGDAGTLDLRMDGYAARLRLSEGPADDLAYAGWEVADEAALDSLAARLDKAGGAVARGDEQACAARRVAGLIRFADPEGNSHEAFYGPLQAGAPFVSPLGVAFRTGPQGLGHLVLRCADKQAMLDFFVSLLGFRISDHISAEIVPGRLLELSFLRCNGRHHSLALADLPGPKRLVHLMVEVEDVDDVGRALDRCRERGLHLSFTLGRHSNDEMLSFYALGPSGFDIEYGWGGIEVDDESWHVLTHDRISAWGHVFRPPPRQETPS